MALWLILIKYEILFNKANQIILLVFYCNYNFKSIDRLRCFLTFSIINKSKGKYSTVKIKIFIILRILIFWYKDAFALNHVTFVQTDSSPSAIVHVYPLSIRHAFEHPSPAILFPSSHASSLYRSPLPHFFTIR